MKISKCNRCGLRRYRTMVVRGNGNRDSRIVFVGEAPGREEDEQGKPFVGQAGKYFAEILEVLGLDRRDIYTTNAVKCRPCDSLAGKNRKPKDIELLKCSRWLEIELERIQPDLIVTMGGVPLEVLTGLSGVSDKHGRAFTGIILNVSFKKKAVVFSLYHPAVLIYNYKKYKKPYYKDTKLLKKLIGELGV